MKSIHYFLIALLVFATIPFSKGVGDWIYEIRFSMVSILTLFYAILSKEFREKKVSIGLVEILLISNLLFGALSITNALNPSLSILTLVFNFSLLVLYGILRGANLSFKFLYRIIGFINVFLILATLLQVFFRKTIFLDELLFYSYLGSKNSMSIWLVITLPFSLMGVQNEKKTNSFLFLLLAAFQMYIPILYRTRSAWWLLIICMIFYTYSYLRKSFDKKNILKFYSIILISVISVLAIPNKLNWNSKTPYSDSMKTMASFEHSSGRVELWKVTSEIIKEFPFFGSGLSNLQVQFKNYIHKTDIDPTIIENVRFTIRSFNGYLQGVAEAGFLYGLVLFFLYIVLPCYFLIKNNCFQSRCFSLMALLIGLNGMIDISINTPHLQVLFIILLSKSAGLFQFKTINYSYVYRSLSVLGILPLMYLSSLFLRSPVLNNSYSNQSMSLWKWDQYWDYHQLSTLSKPERMNDYIESSIERYPNNERHIFNKAMYLHDQGKFERAFTKFITSIKTTYFGRCHKLNYYRFKHFIETQKEIYIFPKDLLNNCEGSEIVRDGYQLIRKSNDSKYFLYRQDEGTHFNIQIRESSGKVIYAQTHRQRPMSFTFYNHEKKAVFLMDNNGDRKFNFFSLNFDKNIISPLVDLPITSTAAPELFLSPSNHYITYWHNKRFRVFKLSDPSFKPVTLEDSSMKSQIYYIKTASVVDKIIYNNKDESVLEMDFEGNQKVLYRSQIKIVDFFYNDGIHTIERDHDEFTITINKNKIKWRGPGNPKTIYKNKNQFYLLVTKGMEQNLYRFGKNKNFVLVENAPLIKVDKRQFLKVTSLRKGLFKKLRVLNSGAENVLLKKNHCEKTYVYIHGGPHMRESYYKDSPFDYLVTEKTCLLKVNYRGSLGYSFDFESVEYRKVDLQIKDVLDSIHLEKELKSSKIYFVAESYGNYVLYNIATLHPNVGDGYFFLSPIRTYNLDLNLDKKPHHFFFGINDDITSFKDLLIDLGKQEGFDKSKFTLFESEGHYIRRHQNRSIIVKEILSFE